MSGVGDLGHRQGSGSVTAGSRSLRIRGARVCDGTGRLPVECDVQLVDGRIAAVERAAETFVGPVLDAVGLVLAPGFIDIHSHSDFTLPAYPEGEHAIRQGVTTEVTGNCGSSPAPLSTNPVYADQWRARAGIAGQRLSWDWRDVATFLGQLDDARPAVNVIPLVGHGTLRVAVMGMTTAVAAPAEVEAMAALLRDAIAAGVWGMSSGLAFPPGSAAAADELASLAAVVASAGGLYATHIRDEGSGLVDAVDEALATAVRAGCSLQISHLKAAGTRSHGKVTAALEAIEAARARGIDVHCDVYPYTAGSTYLRDLLPDWLLDEGPTIAVSRLADNSIRARVRAEILAGTDLAEAGSWDNIFIDAVSTPSLRGASGRSVTELAALHGISPVDAVIDLLVADSAATTMIVLSMSQADNEAVLRAPFAAIGSDQYGVVDRSARVHPRSYGAHSRILGWAVREAGLFGLAEAVRKMTGLPAQIIGLGDRGLIAPGQIADIVLFDPDSVQDVATYEHPTELARGIEHVLIAGQPVIADGIVVNPRAGCVLRRKYLLH